MGITLSLILNKGVEETSIVCLSGHSVGLKAAHSGHDVELRMAKAWLTEHNPCSGINEQRFSRKKLFGLAEHLNIAPEYFFTVDGNPTNLQVSQRDLMDSIFVAAVDNNKVKVYRLKDGDVPRNGNCLDLEKKRDNVDRGCYDWNMRSVTISMGTSVFCLPGHSVGLKATESGHDAEGRMPEPRSRKHGPHPQINEQSFNRKELLGFAKNLGYAPRYFFTVDGNPTYLTVRQSDLMDSTFVAAVDNNKVKVHRMKDGDVPRNGNGLDLKKIRDDADRDCYDWNIGSGATSMGNNHSSTHNKGVEETSVVCLSGHSVGLKAIESGHDADRRMPEPSSREHGPHPPINEQRFHRKELLDSAYFFTVDGSPTYLAVPRSAVMDSSFVAAVDNNKVKVHRLKDHEVPRNGSGLDLEKIRDDAGRGCYAWNIGSGAIWFTSEASSSST